MSRERPGSLESMSRADFYLKKYSSKKQIDIPEDVADEFELSVSSEIVHPVPNKSLFRSKPLKGGYLHPPPKEHSQSGSLSVQKSVKWQFFDEVEDTTVDDDSIDESFEVSRAVIDSSGAFGKVRNVSDLLEIPSSSMLPLQMVTLTTK